MVRKTTIKNNTSKPRSTLKKTTLRNKTIRVQTARAQTVRRISGITEIDTNMHKDYQPLIDAIGADNILESFAEFLGRDGLDVDDNTGASGNIASRIRKSSNSIPADFSGVVYDGAHWKGYESKNSNGSRVVYDSYAYDLQLSGSNNFCQSYATFLWATKGALNFDGPMGSSIHFVKGEYTNNVKKMASLWLAWFDDMRGNNSTSRWLNKAIPFNIPKIQATLKKLSEDDNEAAIFAKSS